MLEITTSWEEAGLERGRREQTFQLVSRLLRRRLGPLPGEIEAELRASSLERSEALAEALLDFSSLAELNHWLETHP